MSKIVTLSEAASIALHGIILVAKSKKLINIVQISETIGSSKHHVAKVFQRLVKDNFIDSHRGPSGGFAMKKAAEDISLLDVYESIEGKIEINDCAIDKPKCPFDKCILSSITRDMTIQYRDYLQAQTLDKYL